MQYQEWMDELEQKAVKMPRIQAALSNFEVLPRLGKLLEKKATSCPECKIYWKKIQDATEHLDQFFDDGNRYAIEFDNLVEEIMKHLKSLHGIRPKGFVLSVYTVLGMVVGVLIGLFIGGFVLSSMKGGVILGWLLGLMVGWFTGKVKEERLRKNNQIF